MTAARSILAWALLVGMAGCQAPAPEPQESPATITRLSTGLLPVYGVEWMPTGELIVGRLVGDLDDARLAVVDRSNGTLIDIPIQADNSCWREHYLSPTALQDGRLGFVHVCMHDADNNPPDETEIRAVGTAGGTVDRVIPIGPLGVAQNVPFAIDLEGREAIVGVGAGICNRLVVYAGDDAPSRLEAEIVGDGKRFSLDDPVSSDGDCRDTGTAFSPSLTEDGRTLAFFASPAAVGLSGPDRLNTPANIYLLDRPTNVVRSILTDVAGAGALRWSPDGRTIAFVGEVADRNGTWLVRPGGTPLRIADDVEEFAWSPDSTRLFASESADSLDDPLLARLLILDVPAN